MSKQRSEAFGSPFTQNVENMALDERVGPNCLPNNYKPILICDTYAHTSEQGVFHFSRGRTWSGGGGGYDRFRVIDGSSRILQLFLEVRYEGYRIRDKFKYGDTLTAVGRSPNECQGA